MLEEDSAGVCEFRTSSGDVALSTRCVAVATGTSGRAGKTPAFNFAASTAGVPGGLASGDFDASNPGRKTGGSVPSVGGDCLAGFVVWRCSIDFTTSGKFLPKIANSGTAARQASNITARTAIMAELCMIPSLAIAAFRLQALSGGY
jgi:hypothetical protein